MNVPLIQKCSQPVSIRDVVKGGYMYVACGKCEACRYAYKSMWMQRLDAECKSSASTLFFTLTYDNDHVPTLTYDKSLNVLISNRSTKDNVYLDDYSFTDSVGVTSIKSQNYAYIQNDPKVCKRIGYACKADIQKFFKRLRRKVQYDKMGLLSNIHEENRTFRYFVTAEYGPDTFRPHFHGLMFFDHLDVSEAVRQCYFGKSWKLCDPKNMDISAVVASASGYVAKYVNCDTSLPDILQIPGKTKTFYLSSRRPAIGVNYFDYSSLVTKVQHHTTKYDRLAYDNNVPVTVAVPIFSAATNFYFPKIYKSYQYDYGQLCEFYRSSYQYCSPEQIRQLGISDFNKLREYVSKLLPNHIKTVSSYIDHKRTNNPKLKLSDLSDFLSYEYILFGVPQNRAAIIKFLIFTSINNLTLNEYVEHYLNYYSVRSSETMSFQYEYQNYLIDKGYSKLDVARFCYPSFFNSLPRHFYSMNDDQLINYTMSISSLGLDHSDVYNSNHILICTPNRNMHDFAIDEDYKTFISGIRDRLVEFNKKRKINHFNNQNQGNYEAF